MNLTHLVMMEFFAGASGAAAAAYTGTMAGTLGAAEAAGTGLYSAVDVYLGQAPIVLPPAVAIAEGTHVAPQTYIGTMAGTLGSAEAAGTGTQGAGAPLDVTGTMAATMAPVAMTASEGQNIEATTIATSLGTHSTLAAATISVRSKWIDPWVALTECQPLRILKRSGETVSQASFLCQLGEIAWDGSGYSQYDRLSAGRYWIRIQFTAETGPAAASWYGLITHDDLSQHGSMEDNWSGDQVLQAVGPEWPLSRVIVDQSVISTQPDVTTIKRGLTFNETSPRYRADSRPPGNRSPSTVGATYVFAEDPDNANRWTARQMVEYLLLGQNAAGDLFLPIFGTGANNPTFVLDSGSETYLDWYSPNNVVCHNRTLYQVLNQIINPRFGLTWSVYVDEASDEFRIKVDSFAPAPINLPSGATLPANDNILALNFNQAFDITQAVDILDHANQYEQICVCGDFRGAIATFSCLDDSLIQAWNSGAELDYYAGASTKAGYATQLAEKQRQNAQVRDSEELKSVFTSFRIPATWDGKVQDGTGQITVLRNVVFPVTDPATGDPIQDADLNETSEPFWNDGLRFERIMPLRADYDYTSDPANPTSIGSYVGVPQNRQSFAMLLRTHKPTDDQWIFSDKLSTLKNEQLIIEPLNNGDITKQKKINGYSFSASLRLSSSMPGFHLRTSGESHLLAGYDWYQGQGGGGGNLPEPYEKGAEQDWQRVAMTAYIKSDTPVEARYPYPPPSPKQNQLSVLYIRFGERARQDYLLKGTILDLQEDANGKPQRVAQSGYVRNDFPWMLDVARAAWNWHSLPRTSFRLEYKQLSNLFEVGDFIEKIGAAATLRATNSVVTSVLWDFQKGTTTIGTQFIDALDITELV